MLQVSKVCFSVHKKVCYGKAVYVCGDTKELGLWKPSMSFKLKWNEEHFWTGAVLINKDNSLLQFKYLVADWDFPSDEDCQWEVGTHNRKIELLKPRKTIICNDKWSMDRILLHLTIPKTLSNNDRLFVVGSIKELGNWKDKKEMARITFRAEIGGNCFKVEDRIGTAQAVDSPEIEAYSYSFLHFRGKPDFRYYYIKKGQYYLSERQTRRVCLSGKEAFLSKANAQDTPHIQSISHPVAHLAQPLLHHPPHSSLSYLNGQIRIYDRSNIDQLVISHVTEQIYVGSYLKSPLDVSKLHKLNITAILSIQSERDFHSHGLSSKYLKLLCEEYRITYVTYSIEDMDAKDFILKARGALTVMRQLIRENYKVYVHCSAGIYRSPQIIALYMAMFQGFSIEEAIETIHEKHPFGQPNYETINSALSLIRNYRKESF